jgi:hypothetical protein
MSDAVREDVRALLQKLSDEELVAAQRCLERMLEERGIDPYAHLDEGDELDDEERERLHAAIRLGYEQMRAGRGRPIQEVVAELRSRR